MKENIKITKKENKNLICIDAPKLFEVADVSSWNNWLSETEGKLNELGYRRFNQQLNSEDFCYWKTFYSKDNEKIYQVGLLFYDYRKYLQKDPMANRIGVGFKCMFIDIGSRMDLSVSDDITLFEFEDMAHTFYYTMNKYTKKYGK